MKHNTQPQFGVKMNATFRAAKSSLPGEARNTLVTCCVDNELLKTSKRYVHFQLVLWLCFLLSLRTHYHVCVHRDIAFISSKEYLPVLSLLRRIHLVGRRKMKGRVAASTLWPCPPICCKLQSTPMQPFHLMITPILYALSCYSVWDVFLNTGISFLEFMVMQWLQSFRRIRGWIIIYVFGCYHFWNWYRN